MLQSIKLFLISILDFFRHKKSYSQDGEDTALAAFFEGRKKYKGFFIDIGAHHPVRFSNTWMYYRKGWKGINIDPTPGSMRSFKMLRSRDINLEIGIGETRSEMLFYCFNEAALNTFDTELAEKRNTGKPYFIKKTLPVAILPLREVLDSYLPKNQVIDFMSVDVEGLDLKVLQSNDWNLFRPTYLLVEDTHFSADTPKESEIYQYLNSVNYHLVAVLRRTIIFESNI